MGKLKVLFHVNENEKWDMALANAANLLKDIGPEGADAVVLANGPSVAAYVDDRKISVMEGLASQGVTFLACRNSLKKMCEGGLCITEEGLPKFITVIPAGVTELARRQAEGYAYIKP